MVDGLVRSSERPSRVGPRPASSGEHAIARSSIRRSPPICSFRANAASSREAGHGMDRRSDGRRRHHRRHRAPPGERVRLFAYVQTRGRTDPILDFLFLNKSGHCEYFATALALVARAARIPARVVMATASRNTALCYDVVRDRNAHAWSKPGPWPGLDDPRCDAERSLPQNARREAGYASSAIDALRVGYDDVTDWLARRTIRQTGIACWRFLVLVWIVRRGARGPRDRARSDRRSAVALSRTAHRALGSRRTHASRRRTPRAPCRANPRRQSGAVTRAYAALRYGSVGDERRLQMK